MSKLKCLKEEFTAITGLPAKKAIVEVVCPTLIGLKMLSISDWEKALTKIEPRFKLQTYQDYQTKVEVLEKENQTLTTALTTLTNLTSKPEPVSKFVSVSVSEPEPIENLEDVAYLLTETECKLLFTFLLNYAKDTKSAYRKLSKKFHPDINKSPKATALTALLNDVYSNLNNEGSTDEDNDTYYTKYDQQGYDYDSECTVSYDDENLPF